MQTPNNIIQSAKYKLTGGIHPAENKRQSLNGGLLTMPLPKQLIFPLNAHIGTNAIPIVAVGDKVKKGQCIAKTNGHISAAIHASSSGTIRAIQQSPILHPAESEVAQAVSIHLETDGLDEWHESCILSAEQSSNIDYNQLDNQNIIEKISNAGIIGMGGAGFPSRAKLSTQQPITTLIINAVECEPYITADHCLILHRADDIIKGIKILKHYLNAQPNNQTSKIRVIIGIEDNKPEPAEKLATAIGSDTDIELISIPTRYPSGGEKQLIQILTGVEIGSGKIPASKGIVMYNPATVTAIYEAVIHNRPVISRITTVVGKNLGTEANVEVLIGTRIHDILTEYGFKSNNNQNRVIIGGPMMGYCIENLGAPLIKTTNCILLPTNEELPLPAPAKPCIRCGLCAEVCPASLLPQQLFWHSQHHNEDQLKLHNLFDCIECGACAYVCPSQIPLVQYYRSSKATIRHNAIEKQQSDKARLRFEARQQRIEHQQKLKAEKREARQKAAALKKADDNKVQQAIDAIKSQQSQQSPEQELEKLERQIITLTERMTSYNNDINNDDIAEEKKTTIAAKLKNTQARFDKAIERKQQLLSTMSNMSDEVNQ